MQAYQPLILVSLMLAVALALPGALAAAADDLYFTDDFSGEGERAFFEGTLDNRVFRYRDGSYEIDTTLSDSYGQSVLLESLETYRVEVTGRLVETADPDGGGFGLSFNYAESEGGSDFLLLLVYDRGAFTVLRYLDGATSVVYSPTKTKLFSPGEDVRLTVDAAAGNITCYLNGGQVAELTESRLKGGGFGLFATARSVAHFDGFNVYAATPELPGFTDDMGGEQRLYTGEYGEVHYTYQDGAYIIDTSATEYIGLSPFPEEALSFEFACDAELISGDALGGYGIYLRDYATDGGGFYQYRFLVSEGWFAVEKSEDDLPLALAEWMEHSAVREGEANRLKVRADGEQLTFFLNGVEVYKHADTRPHAGSFGFYASSGIKVSFDNVSFTEL
jgi:hypothetical protein